MEHQISPRQAVPLPLVLRAVLGAALRGKLRVIGEVLAMAKRSGQIRREWRGRKRLPAEVDVRGGFDEPGSTERSAGIGRSDQYTGVDE